jgi:branched-chain amino acid transport system ATP-binding protein
MTGAPAASADEGPLLSVVDLAVSFGGVRAVDQVTLEVGPGELVGLIGPNGAGKTTTIDAITGFVPHRGSVRLAGRELAALRPHERARQGLGRTWQSVELFDDLTVEENCRVAATRPSIRTTLAELVRPPTAVHESTAWALEVVGLQSDADRVPTELSHGHRKLVGVARALSARPSVLLLDEPAAGLDTAESERLGERLRTVVDHGVAGLLVDHDMGLVLGICDRIYVLDFGRVIAEGPPSAVRDDERVITAYLGRTRPDEADPEVARTVDR